MNDLTNHTSAASPFDAIRHTRPDGSEYWSARELMPLMGYSRWEHFKIPLGRAEVTSMNQGVDVNQNFRVSRKVSGTRGPAREDFELSRFAAYLVAMNGDPNKPEVAAAQSYFAIRTREAEVAPKQLTGPALYLAAIEQAQAEIAALEAAREKDKRKVLFADSVAASHTSILVGELAKILKGNGVDIGGTRLFAELRRDGFLIKREGTDRNMPTQYAMERGLFEIKETVVTHSDGHVTISKTPKVTGRGQQYFIDRYLSQSDMNPEEIEVA